MKNIPQQLKDLGASKGLCQEWQDKLQGEVTVEFLAVLFKYGIQFFVNNDYPTLDYLRENFKGDTSQYNIYIDEIADCENIKKIVLNGESVGFLKYSQYSIGCVIVRHKSKCSVNTSGDSHVIVDCFDDTELFVAASGESKIVVNAYGNAKVNIVNGNVIVNKLNKNKYYE